MNCTPHRVGRACTRADRRALDALGVLVGVSLLGCDHGLPTMPTWPLHQAVAQIADPHSRRQGRISEALRRVRFSYSPGLGVVSRDVLRAVEDLQRRRMLRHVAPGWWRVAAECEQLLRREQFRLGSDDRDVVAAVRAGWVAAATESAPPS